MQQSKSDREVILHEMFCQKRRVLWDGNALIKITYFVRSEFGHPYGVYSDLKLTSFVINSN
jgi:hypothetical protein